MSNTKHTPGPWKVGTFEEQGYSIDASNPLHYVAHVYGGYEPDETCIANAKLIAAAPEMLEALEGIAKMDNKDFAYSFHTKEETAKQIMFIGQLAKAAIKKATE